MNALTKSLTMLALFAGMTLTAYPALAASPAVLPAPAQSALTSLLAQSDGPLPPGTKLLSLRLTDGLATVNFSHDLQDNFPGGDTAETRAVNSILQTLGQFPTISHAQILVEGHTIDSLGGLLVLSDPLPVIRPVDDAAAAQAGHRWLHRKTRIMPHAIAKPRS